MTVGNPGVGDRETPVAARNRGPGRSQAATANHGYGETVGDYQRRLPSGLYWMTAGIGDP